MQRVECVDRRSEEESLRRRKTEAKASVESRRHCKYRNGLGR